MPFRRDARIHLRRSGIDEGLLELLPIGDRPRSHLVFVSVREGAVGEGADGQGVPERHRAGGGSV